MRIRKTNQELRLNMLRLLFRLLYAVPLIAVLGCLPLIAQGTNGRFSGQVTDPDGGAIPGASVQIINQETFVKREAKTDSSGSYTVVSLPPGRYQVIVEADGFGSTSSQVITLTAGQAYIFNAPMSVSGVQTQVEVDGRDVLNTSINASRGQGEPLMVYPSIDAIQDMKVLTADYSALYGKSASGSVLITTKSGTEKFHGNIYGFLRNEMFNARNYFDQPDPTRLGYTGRPHYRTPLYRRLDFGATIGGPLFITHIYNNNRNKTYFFSPKKFAERRRLWTTTRLCRQWPNGWAILRMCVLHPLPRKPARSIRQTTPIAHRDHSSVDSLK